MHYNISHCVTMLASCTLARTHTCMHTYVPTNTSDTDRHTHTHTNTYKRMHAVHMNTYFRKGALYQLFRAQASALWMWRILRSLLCSIPIVLLSFQFSTSFLEGCFQKTCFDFHHLFYEGFSMKKRNLMPMNAVPRILLQKQSACAKKQRCRHLWRDLKLRRRQV